jgi:hypothetical protein
MKKNTNIFELYTGKLYDKLNKEATRDIKKAIKSGVLNETNIVDHPLLSKFRNVGASDTASREAIYCYIINLKK